MSSASPRIFTIISVDPGETNLAVCFLSFNEGEEETKIIHIDHYLLSLGDETPGAVLESRILSTCIGFKHILEEHRQKHKADKMFLVVEQQFGNSLMESIAAAILTLGALSGFGIKSRSPTARYKWLQKHLGVKYNGKTKSWRKNKSIEIASKIEQVLKPDERVFGGNTEETKLDDCADAFLQGLKEIGSMFGDVTGILKEAAKLS